MSLLNFNGTRDERQNICLSRLAAQPDENSTSAFDNTCGVVWDGFNCWGPAVPGSRVYSACPAAKGMDVTKQAYRNCDSSGLWLSKEGFPDVKGWTNYTPCFTPEILALIQKLYSGSEMEAMSKIEIARRTRMLEIFGLSLSLLALLLSLFVFYYFRSLRNHRTRLHRHLFIAMIIQVAVRLTLYIDQFIVRSKHLSNKDPDQQGTQGIDNTPILCEAAYICLEYARTSMFMWMFVEGLYLHNMITVTVFEEKLSPIYPLVGWVFPIPLTLSWAFVTAKQYGTATCWWGYNFTWYFWILEGPRMGVLVINLAFLLNILRVLVTKLRESNSSGAHQARKAVKAALVLLPLLGLTNLLNMLDAPLERSAAEFGLWSYTTHAFTSCQGLILACLYCFLNGEVRLALKKFFRYELFNVHKKRGSSGLHGTGKGSARLSAVLNNSVAGRRSSISTGEPTRRIDLLESHSRRNTQFICLNNVLTCNPTNIHLNSNKEPMALAELVTSLNSGDTINYSLNSETTIHFENDTSSVGRKNSNSFTQSTRTSYDNHQSSVDYRNEASQLNRSNKLRMWVSPFSLLNSKTIYC